MVVTRSHKTFNDDEPFVSDEIKAKKDLIINKQEESESDSEDEAPEEESISDSKKNALARQKADEELLKQKRAAAKAKHREVEEKRKITKLEKELKELEKKRKELEGISEDLPEELPEDLLEDIDLDKPAPSKIVFNNEEEEEKIQKANKRKNRQERLQKLRELKGKTEKQVSGGIHVKVLGDNKKTTNFSSKDIATKKDQWLMRKRIRRE